MQNIILTIASIAIGILTLFGGGAYIKEGRSQSRLSTFHSEVQMWAQMLSNRYAQQGSYGAAAITCANLIVMGAVPPTAQVNGTCLGPWKKATTVTGAGATVYVDYEGMSQQECVAILTDTPSNSGVVSYRVGTAANTFGSALTVPTAPTTAATTCTASTTFMRVELPL